MWWRAPARAVDFEHLIEWCGRCRGRAGIGAGRPGRRGPATRCRPARSWNVRRSWCGPATGWTPRSPAACGSPTAPRRRSTTGMKTMASWLRGHCRLSAAAAFQIVRTGRALEQLPAVAAGFADGAVTAEQVAVIAPVTRPEHLAAPPRRASTSPRSTRCWPRPRPAASTSSCARRCALPGPPGPRRRRTRPHRGPVADAWSSTPTAPGPAGSSSTRSAGRRRRSRWSRSCRPAGRRAMSAPAPSSSVTRSSQLVDNALASGTLPFLRTVKPHVACPDPARRPDRPGHRPGRRPDGLRGAISAARARWLACDGILPGW